MPLLRRARPFLAAAGLLAFALGSTAAETRFLIEDTRLSVMLPDGRRLEGKSLIGLSLTLDAGSVGQTVRVESVDVEASASGPVTLYGLVSLDGSHVCKPDARGRNAAILVPAEQGSFDLTCTSGAEGKCILLGYHPWRHDAQRPMRDLHRACIHLIRADYRGDDRPTTRDGTLIDVYDRFGIQHPENGSDMHFEAAWGLDGALCVARTRIADAVDLDELAARYPRLRGRVGVHACNEMAMKTDPAALLFNRSQGPEP